VAALLDVAQISEITAIESADTFVRPVYAGNVLATVQSADAIKVITVRTTAFDAAGQGGSAAVETVAAVADAQLSSFVGQELTKSDRPELGAAKIIVSGGRALGSEEQFKSVIEPLADKLGAAVGASAPRLTLATRRTTTRLARPARWWRRNCTSPWAFPVPSSIWLA
jgi:electron transfer flavoprotein alpha subunit